MDHIAQIKARLPIADVVGTYIRLERAGSNFRALCPFHKEKSPSFNVSPARDAYYCFGCAKGGDIFTFVQEVEGLSFPEALKVLAGRAGVQLPERSSAFMDQQKNARDRLVELMETATQVFEAHLARSPEVMGYLLGRGLTEETIAKFRIGFAPLEWRGLYDALRLKGYSDDELERARVVKKVEGKGYYDTFRGRVMFPIADSSGRVIAFTGRVFGDQRAHDGTPVAKYLNSPEGELYDKSRVLFAYDRAKVPMRKADHAILVEGQMDCIMSHQAGVEQTIAISGTALTQPQIALIKRLTNKIVLALDADNAGVQATLRSAKLALADDIQVRVVMIPDGKDPADYIVAHPGKWSEVLLTAEPVVPYLLRLYAKQNLHGDALRERIQKEVFPLITALPSKIAQAQLISEVSRVLAVREDAVWDDVKKMAQQEALEAQHATHMYDEPAAQEAPKVLVSTRTLAEEELLGLLLWQEAHDEPMFDTAKIRNEYDNLYDVYPLQKCAISEADGNRLLMIAESKYVPGSKFSEIAEELIDRIETELIKELREQVVKRIAHAESTKEDVFDLIKQQLELDKKRVLLEDRVRSRPTIYN